MLSRIPQDWPNRTLSRMVDSRPHHWHVQIAGSGPTVLLLHGTGSSAHTWRGILPRLLPHARVVAPDLPGHGFTRMGTRQRSSLPAMAEDLLQLCRTLEASPDLIVGHSAGAALAVRISSRMDPLVPVIGLNAALTPFRGPASWIFPMMARTLAAVPLVPSAVSGVLSATGAIGPLLKATGSRLDEAGLRYYRHLVSRPDHVEGAIAMMSQWSAEQVWTDLETFLAPLTLMTGSLDATVPPDESERAAAQAPNSSVESLGNLGHLAHEEAPEMVADAILEKIKQPSA